MGRCKRRSARRLSEYALVVKPTRAFLRGPVGGTSLKRKRKVTGHGAFKRRGGSRGAARGADESFPRKIPE